MDAYVAIVKFFQEGGVFMYPIVVVFAIGFVIVLERWFFLTQATVSNQREWKKLVPLVSAGRYDEANNMASKSKSAIGNILSYGLDRAKSARRRDDIEKAMEESLLEVTPRLERRTHLRVLGPHRGAVVSRRRQPGERTPRVLGPTGRRRRRRSDR